MVPISEFRPKVSPAHFQLASLPLADKLPPKSAVQTPGSGDRNSYRKIRVFVASPGGAAEEMRGLGKVIESDLSEHGPL